MSQDQEQREQQPVFNVYWPFEGVVPVAMNRAFRDSMMDLLDEFGDDLEPHFAAFRRMLEQRSNPRKTPFQVYHVGVSWPFQGVTPVWMNQDMRREMIKFFQESGNLESHFLAFQRMLEFNKPRDEEN